MLDGKIIGKWKRVMKKHRVEISYEVVDENLMLDQDALFAEGLRYANFWGMEEVKINRKVTEV